MFFNNPKSFEWLQLSCVHDETGLSGHQRFMDRFPSLDDRFRLKMKIASLGSRKSITNNDQERKRQNYRSNLSVKDNVSSSADKSSLLSRF